MVGLHSSCVGIKIAQKCLKGIIGTLPAVVNVGLISGRGQAALSVLLATKSIRWRCLGIVLRNDNSELAVIIPVVHINVPACCRRRGRTT